MSEVYIRSQNKEKLYRLGGNYACVEYGEYEDVKKKRGGAEADKKRHVICISDGCLEEIGEYATKERCLEVLDEIQKACVSYLFTAGGAAVIRGGMDVQPFATVIPRLYEIIDNPPDIGLNVVNALAITDEVIVPVKVDEDALEGLDIVTEQIEDAKAFNPALKLAGVLITSYQNTDGEAAGVEWLEQKTDFNILGIIRYSKKVAENTFMRKPIYEYSPCCGAAQGYKKFVTAYTGKAR